MVFRACAGGACLMTPPNSAINSNTGGFTQTGRVKTLPKTGAGGKGCGSNTRVRGAVLCLGAESKIVKGHDQKNTGVSTGRAGKVSSEWAGRRIYAEG